MKDYTLFMIRDKEDLMRGLKCCEKADCDNCPYSDIGCSPCLAYDTLLVIENSGDIYSIEKHGKGVNKMSNKKHYMS